MLKKFGFGNRFIQVLILQRYKIKELDICKCVHLPLMLTYSEVLKNIVDEVMERQ